MAHPHVFAMVLAGGEGKRLAPLTADRAKPAVPFGGDYRLVDFVLSNLVNGGYLAAWRPTLSDVPCVASIDCRRPSRKDSWSPQSPQ
jgi:hypothetical protein